MPIHSKNGSRAGMWSIAPLLALLVVGCGPSGDESSHPEQLAETPVETSNTPEPAPPTKMVSDQGQMIVRGFHLGMSRAQVMMRAKEIGAGLVATRDGPSLLVADAENCSPGHAQTPEQNAIARECKVLGIVGFDDQTSVNHLTFYRSSFKAEHLSADAFAQAIVDNYPVSQLKPVAGAPRSCSWIQGQSDAGETVTVEECPAGSELVVSAGMSATQFD